MAEEELQAVELSDAFYRGGFGKVMLMVICIGVAILLLIALSIYIYLDKPVPISFSVAEEWRVQPDVPVSQPYLSTPEVLQWLGDVLPRSFTFDFNRYNEQLKRASQYFTENGWKAFLNQLNTYANYNTVTTNKLFVNGVPSNAPFLLRQPGILSDTGAFGWWVQFPIEINYAGQKPPLNKIVTFQVLVVRVPTLNNLTGVGIDNILLAPITGSP
jgi:intracellular multiplication protein IcmL